MTNTLPKIVRQRCVFCADESASTIDARIIQTEINARLIAKALGMNGLDISCVYGPTNEDDLNATIGRKGATNWRNALCECHWGRYAFCDVIVRESA